MAITSVQVALVVTLVVAVGFAWTAGDRGRWRALLEDRFVYGVPWGTLVTVAVVVAFYLLAQVQIQAQDGARHWAEPVTFPYVSWSYFYLTGLVTSGIAHGSTAHLVSNMTGTLAFAPIAEYAWGHYSPSARSSATASKGTSASSGPNSGSTSSASAGRNPRSDAAETDSRRESGDELEDEVTDGGLESGGGGESESESGGGGAEGENDGGWLTRPWVRALVVFPGALLASAFATALFSLGPGLGFSGAVFALAGFAVVTYPVTTLLGVVAASGLGTLYDALSEPVVRATIEPGTPGPPTWAGVGFQAHALGFLVGVLLGIALLSRRERGPNARRVFLATVLLGLVQALWLVSGSGGEDVYVLYRGTGVVLVLVLAMLVAVAVAGSDRPISALPRSPTRRQLGVACLVIVTVLVALPSVPLNLMVVGDGTVPGSGGVDVRDYTVTYEENATSGHAPAVDLGDDDLFASRQSGVIVVSPERELWTVGIRPEVLEHEGNDTLQVGAPGWRETVRADRSGWTVVGNESAYVVDLTVDGETTRSFASEPVRANAVLDDRAIEVVPGEEEFLLRVTRIEDGEQVGETPIPGVGETATAGDLEFVTERVGEDESGDDGNDNDDGTVRVFAETDGARVQIAERESYD